MSFIPHVGQMVPGINDCGNFCLEYILVNCEGFTFDFPSQFCNLLKLDSTALGNFLFPDPDEVMCLKIDLPAANLEDTLEYSSDESY